ncbi:MAG TPA: hypothetical protein VMU04_05725 [Candidatus Acidoferrum sp.]|nr:hypothetical protein [Candidatus Acidoferrum sp.]
MTNASTVLRSLIIYGLCLPLAAILGYLLATPLDLTTLTVVGAVLFLLLIPLFLRWHHPWLIATWNMSAVLFFVPGRPQVWMGLAVISFCIGVLQYTINRNMKFLYVPSVTWPLLFLTAVVVITARLRGGIGLRAFGGSVYGGKNYVMILAAVLGYFALTSRSIPSKRAVLYVTLFFLGLSTLAIGELPRVLPSGLNFVFWIFPVFSGGIAAQQTTAVVGATGDMERINGLAMLGMGIFFAMLARYGLHGILLEPRKPWRLAILGAGFLIGLLGGFRSALLLMAMTFALLFFLEGLHHTKLLLVLTSVAFLGGTLMLAFANRLPFYMQRSLAFLPVDIDPLARLSAESSSAWRLQMWSELLPQVPDYLALGKGYAINPREMEMLGFSRTGESGIQGAELAGDYHNGPLSLIIPFGVFGVIGFVWFLWAGFRVLHHNFQFGHPEYQHLNTFLFGYFCVKVVFFFVVFGGFASELMSFTGLVGLSISLNGGMAKSAIVTPEAKPVFNRFRLHPSVRRPAQA